MFLLNSRYPLLCATPRWLPNEGSRLSRSYASNLPSSFGIVLSSALVYSTSPPVSVSGTVYSPELFPGTRAKPGQSVKPRQQSASVTSGRLGNINPIPIDYGSRPRLRGPANPARINLAQEPLDFRRQRFSRCLSLLMSAFALLISPAPLTGTPSQTYRTLRYRTVVSCQSSVFRQAVPQTVQHPRDLRKSVLPPQRHRTRHIRQIGGIIAS